MLAKALLWTALLSGPQEPEDPGALARAILERGGYQTELPGDRPDPTWESCEGSGRRGRTEGEGEGGRIGRRGAGRWTGDADGLGVLLWIALGFAAVFGVAWIIGNARGHHRDVGVAEDRGDTSGPEQGPPVVAPRASALEAAARLARAGRFTEAIRALLHDAFEGLRRRGNASTAPWLTSREILRRSRLPASALASLTALVDAVERGLFARREPGATEYDACLRAYRALGEESKSAS